MKKVSQAQDTSTSETFNAAVKAYVQEDYKESIRLFRLALQQGEHPFLLNGLGMAYLASNKPQDAATVFERAVFLMPSSAALHANLGAARYALSEIAEAETQFATALRLDPQNAEALVGSAVLAMQKQQPEKGLRFLSQLTGQDAQTSEVRYNKALALYQMGLSKDAEKILKDHVSANPDDADALNALGVVSLRNKNLVDAKAYMDRAIALSPHQGIYYYNRGNVLKEQKDLPTAVEDYSRAISLSPEMAEAYVNRGEIRFLLRETDDACQDLEQACTLGFCDRLKKYQEAGQCRSGLWK